jgi:hypothetical protein
MVSGFQFSLHPRLKLALRPSGAGRIAEAGMAEAILRSEVFMSVNVLVPA